MKKVQVLMSTYNGEKFLREQVDSLIRQRDVEIHLLVRDDGSNDRTFEILDSYKGMLDIEIYSGENLKSARSFMDLIYRASENYDYYALCDQDDVWIDNKMICATSKLENIKSKPALYYCGMSIVDKNLNKYGRYYRDPIYSTSLYMSSLFGNEIAGCTMVFNKELLIHLREYNPQFITLHDGWIHRVCLCVHGEIVSDPGEYILYRQHENNVEGMKKISMITRFRNLCSHKKYFSRLAYEMVEGYHMHLSDEEKTFLSKISAQDKMKNRLYTAFYNHKVKIGLKERMNLIFKVLCGSF